MIVYIFIRTIVKSGILIYFCPRTLRICSPCFVNDEIEHNKNSFSLKQYPESFIHRVKSKTLKIHKHISYYKNNQINSNIYPIKRYDISSKSHNCPHCKKLKTFSRKNRYSSNKNQQFLKNNPKRQTLPPTQVHIKSVVKDVTNYTYIYTRMLQTTYIYIYIYIYIYSVYF